MSRGLDPRFMQKLKAKNNIIEVIGSYVSLDRKGGNNVKVLSPFFVTWVISSIQIVV